MLQLIVVDKTQQRDIVAIPLFTAFFFARFRNNFKTLRNKRFPNGIKYGEHSGNLTAFTKFILRNNAAIVRSKASGSYVNFQTRSSREANIESRLKRLGFLKIALFSRFMQRCATKKKKKKKKK